LAEARNRLDEAKAAHEAGTLVDLLAEWKPPKVEPEADAPEGTLLVRDLAKPFMRFIEQRRRRPDVVQDVLDRDLVPFLGDKAVAAVTTVDVRRLVDAVVTRGAASHAGRVLQTAHQLFRFAQGRGDITLNPAEPLDAGALGVVNNSSKRFLTTEEIPLFWRALDTIRTPTVRNALRLLLLLGTRTGELLAAEWDEIDLKAATWTVPVAHQKLTKRAEREAKPFTIPLPPTAIEILHEMRALAGSIKSPMVCASFAPHKDDRGGKRIGGPLSDKVLNHSMRRLFEGETPALVFQGERPTPHDLRRTLRTHLGETLGIEPHIAERCLNHSLGRIVATYDRGDYLEQRRDALTRWDAHIAALVEGKTAKVVGIKAKRKAAQS